MLRHPVITNSILLTNFSCPGANPLQIPFVFSVSVIFSFLFCRSSFSIPQQFLLFIKMQLMHLSSVPHLFCYSVFFLCPHDRNLMRLVRCFLWLWQLPSFDTACSGFLRPGAPKASPLESPSTVHCKIDSIGPFVAGQWMQAIACSCVRVSACQLVSASIHFFWTFRESSLILSPGTLYAGDGVVIQRNLVPSLPCVSTLRYPRSSFAYGNMTLYVCTLCLLW